MRKVKTASFLAIVGLLAGLVAATPARAQNSNEIVAVVPDSAQAGTTGLLVAFTLDSDVPPPPPAGAMPDSATIGSLSGASITHSSQYTVTAVFDIPAGETSGAKDAAVTFTTPNGTVVFSAVGGFSVTAAPNTPPGVVSHPRSLIARVGEAASFGVSATGSDPLDYQWRRDGGDLAGATAATLTILSVTTDDAGDYDCLVTNSSGSDLSDAATLSVDISVPTVSASWVMPDTEQFECYDDATGVGCPAAGAAFHGQDAQFDGYATAFSISGDGLTVHDATTGLTWTRSTDLNDDGTIDADDKLTFAQALAYPATLNAISFGGHNDWRLPSIKEVYSLMDFRGEDASGYTGSDPSRLVPFIDTTYFEYGYGDLSAVPAERLIDSQYVSSTEYVSTTMDGNATVFGVNFADGRIKGYPQLNKLYYVALVRGNPSHGINDFVDNSDGTITDLATGLMWQKVDSIVTYNWEQALDYAEGLVLAGHSDWRLPNVKELQGIVDYTRSPATSGTPAIDPLFDSTSITNEGGQFDYNSYWSGTTHATYGGGGGWGSYVSFGRSLGYWSNIWQDVHGAGAQRSDPKNGDPADYPTGHGPQGDAIRVYNHVRVVRGGDGPLRADFGFSPEAPADGASVSFTGSGSGGTSPYGYAWNVGGTPESGESVLASLPVGVHSVTLTVTDAAALETQVTREITVSATSPPPLADGKLAGSAALFSQNAGDPDLIDVTYDNSTCSTSQTVILYGNLGEFGAYAGAALDDAGGDGTAVIDSAGLDDVWFNIVWTSGDTAGHPGYAFDGSSDLERTWSAAGLAGMTSDDHANDVCE
ncbi:MAG: DUF1566 domain-containing protein [bacterium]|nr:DUF1566 domain-containing protein [bacterium]